MKYRNPWIVLLLSFVSLGFYNIYWLYQVSQETQKNTQEKLPTMWRIAAPLLVAPVYILGVVQESVPILIIAGIAFLALMAVTLHWYWLFAKLLARATNDKTPAALTFLLFLLIDELAPAILQYFINKSFTGAEKQAQTNSDSSQLPGQL